MFIITTFITNIITNIFHLTQQGWHENFGHPLPDVRSQIDNPSKYGLVSLRCKCGIMIWHKEHGFNTGISPDLLKWKPKSIPS
jgi:hypothetical protein